MFNFESRSNGAGLTQPTRVVAIIKKQQVVELWHIFLQRTDYKERDIDLPVESTTRVVNGRRQRRDVYRRKLARQAWGHFVIKRYRATRMLPWTPALALTMLIPGTLLAAGTANQGILQMPLGLLVTQSVLITIGGLLAVSSGWRILTTRIRVSGDIALESLGVSGHALGFPKGVVASEPLPGGYRAGRFKGDIEVDLPVGEWNVVEARTADVGWHFNF